MSKKNFFISTLLSLSALIFTTGAYSKSYEHGIVLYNAQHENLAHEWVEKFTHETGIKVTIRNGSDTELSNQIIQEGSSSPADVFITENSPAMVLVDSYGLLEPIPISTLNQIEPNYRPSHGRWVGIAARSTVFVYNKNRLRESNLPKSLEELSRPIWKGRWAASPTGADFQAIVSAMLELKGENATLAWLRMMKQNAIAYKGNNTVMKAVNSGQVDGGIIYHYYYFVDRSKTGENSNNNALHYFKGKDPGAFVSISGGGVLKSSKNKEKAQIFLKWVTSKHGQNVLKNGNSYEYAVGVNAKSNQKLLPLKKLDSPKIDIKKLNGRKVIDLMMRAGLL
ncbi:MAG: iron ABC transporter substrate-binding protein [Burkholderia sp.]|nr:iron ABC transporter substrate-binding protein [Burkholderia sp.]